MIEKIEIVQSHERIMDEKEKQLEDAISIDESHSSTDQIGNVPTQEVFIPLLHGTGLNRECALIMCRKVIGILLSHMGFESQFNMREWSFIFLLN